MKKSYSTVSKSPGNFHFFRRATVFGFLLLFLLYAGVSRAQGVERFDFRVSKVPLNTAIEQLREVSGVSFSYNVDDLSRYTVSVDVRQKTLEEVLNKCLENTDLGYKSIDKTIIVYKKTTKKEPNLQGITIRGVVREANGKPLPGVTVAIKGAQIGVTTNLAGEFSINVLEYPTLVFTFVGMKPVEVKYTGQSFIQVTMQEDITEIGEVVVTGYQTIDRRKNTSAVTSVKAEDVMIPGVSSIDKMLEGRIPDMMLMTNSGEVGVVPKIRIRGTSTLVGNREPLWVVDGIVVQDPVNISPEELNDPDYINRIGNAIAGLNPWDIERLDILKDAAATALYGTRAANGVIVITTKKGQEGRPIVTYSMNTTLRQRPRYTDRKVNVMNSKERIQFSRELMASHYQYPNNMTMVGYEKLVSELYDHQLTNAEFDREVAKLEALNTDWFDLLTEDSFSHQHTISISGGSKQARYYASIGYNRDNDVIKTNKNERYTAALNLDANLTPWLTASLGVNGNVSSRDYYQSEIAPMEYAYRTSRAIPAYTENGEYYYYTKRSSSSGYNYNILNELDNSSYGQEGSGLTVNANLQFKFTDWLNANAIVSYSTSNTTIEGYWGEKTYHAALLRGSEYGVMPEPYTQVWDDYWEESGGYSLLPYGGELSRQESANRSYTVRLQLNANKYFGLDQQHNINANFGYEMSSTRYKSYSNLTRGYYPDRGKSFVTNVDLEAYPDYGNWLANNAPSITDDLNNTISGYASLSYSYYNYFTLNVNARIDGSNKFGDRSNDKLLPIWSVSGSYNISEQGGLKNSKWIDYIRLKTSFGYQGNMLSEQSPVMLIAKKPTDAYFGELIATIDRYPNPDLKWEKTTSYNLGLEFGLFENRLQVEASYYLKHTKDAFMTKTIADMNGVANNSYVVNGGNVDNKGYSIALTISPVKTKDFRWTLSTVISKSFNKVKDDPDANEYELSKFLNGTAIVKGKSIGTFYSYKFLGLSPVDGGPLFDDYADRAEMLLGLSKYDTYTRVLEASGKRDPDISGSLNTTVRWKNLRLSGSFAYSLGNKIRLMGLYTSAQDKTRNAMDIRPEYNVSKDYLKRWQKRGDELTTTIPAIISEGNGDTYYKYRYHWSTSSKYENDVQPLAENVWDMYDYGNHRVVSDNYLKCSNLSLTYEFAEPILNKLKLSRLALTLSGANLFTICSKKLDGQTPTQSGFAAIQLSDRPNYSFGLSVSF